MNEILSSQSEHERPETEAKQLEANYIAEIVGTLREALHGEATGRDAASWALDDVLELCKSLAKRDPELGGLLVDSLESHASAAKDQDISDRLRNDLGLPRRGDDWTPPADSPPGPGAADSHRPTQTPPEHYE